MLEELASGTADPIPSLVLAALTLLALGWGALRPANRDIWKLFRGRDLFRYLLLAGFGVLFSFHFFDSISDHSFVPHEELLFRVFSGDELEAPATELNPLIAWIYGWVGQHLGRSMTAFVWTAVAIGCWGPALLGMTVQLLTRRAVAGYVAATLLAVHPWLAYWRLQAYPISVGNTCFALALLAAAVAAARPDLLNLLAWLLAAALAVCIRADLVGAAVATAAIPLLCGRNKSLKALGKLLLALVGTAVVAGVPLWQTVVAIDTGADHVLGWRFVGLHVRIPGLLFPLTSPWLTIPLLAGVAAAGWSGRVEPPVRRAARAMLVIALAGLFPAISFMSFGPRHLVATNMALIAVAVFGCTPAAWPTGPSMGRRARIAVGLLLAVCLVGGAGTSIARVVELADHYGQNDLGPPQLANGPRPEGELNTDFDGCVLVYNSGALCNSAECAPPKLLVDPREMRRVWDYAGGCVLWVLDTQDDDTRGIRHEWWVVARTLENWVPEGIITLRPGHPALYVYRLTERP